MKTKTLSIALVLYTSIIASTWAETEPANNRFGAHMAVTAFDKEEGFRLSERGTKSLGISFQNLKSSSPWKAPKSALVNIKHSTGVYRKVDGWVSLVLVNVLKSEKESVTFASEDLQTGDDIAVSGTQFLRMTDLDLNSDTVDTCSH